MNIKSQLEQSASSLGRVGVPKGAIACAIAAMFVAACGPNPPSSTVAPTLTSAQQVPLVAAVPATTSPTVMPAAPPIESATTPPLPATTTAVPPTPQQPVPRIARATKQSRGAASPTYAPPPTYEAQSQTFSGDDNVAPSAPQARPVPDARVSERRPVGAYRVGSIEAIEPIVARPKGVGAGAVIGGVLGAVAGNQFGHGGGRALMTGAGAVGGALAGHTIQRGREENVTGYRVSIRLDNGTTRTFERPSVNGLQVGDRVRVDGGGFRRA